MTDDADLATLRASLAAADASNAALFDALYDYGQHTPRCATQNVDLRDQNPACTCGLEAIVTAPYPGERRAAVVDIARRLIGVRNERELVDLIEQLDRALAALDAPAAKVTP